MTTVADEKSGRSVGGWAGESSGQYSSVLDGKTTCSCGTNQPKTVIPSKTIKGLRIITTISYSIAAFCLRTHYGVLLERKMVTRHVKKRGIPLLDKLIVICVNPYPLSEVQLNGPKSDSWTLLMTRTLTRPRWICRSLTRYLHKGQIHKITIGLPVLLYIVA